MPRAGDPDLFISGSRPKFFAAIDKKKASRIQIDRNKEIKDKKKGKGLKEDKQRRKRKTVNLQDLIDDDKLGKRRLKYSVLGCNILSEDAQEKLSTLDKKQRDAHHEEKLEKMKNPNFFVSENKVLFKNIDKKLDTKMLKQKIETLVREIEPKGALKNKKILKKVNLLEDNSEKSTSFANRGSAFVEFTSPELAENFLKNVGNIQKAKVFNTLRLPIIEYSFEDIRKVR